MQRSNPYKKNHQRRADDKKDFGVLFALHPLKQNEEDKILNGIATFQEKEHHHPFEICSFDETPQFKALKTPQ